MGIHADRGSVDDDLRVQVAAVTFLIADRAVSFNDIDDDHLCGAFVTDDRLHRCGSPAVADDQHLFSIHAHTVFSDHILETGVICVVAIQLSIAVDHRVDRPDRLGCLVQFIQIGDDRFLIWDRDIDSRKVTIFHKGTKGFLVQRDQIIAVIRDRLMDLLRKAVGEMFSDQTIRFHNQVPFSFTSSEERQQKKHQRWKSDALKMPRKKAKYS